MNRYVLDFTHDISISDFIAVQVFGEQSDEIREQIKGLTEYLKISRNVNDYEVVVIFRFLSKKIQFNDRIQSREVPDRVMGISIN